MEPKLSGYEPEQIKQIIYERLMKTKEDEWSFGEPHPDVIEAVRAAKRGDAIKQINQNINPNG